MNSICTFHKNEFLERFGISVEKHSFNSFREHNHNFYEFEYILDGQTEYVIDNEKHICKKHDLIYASPQNTHGYNEINGAVTTVTVHFTDEVLKQALCLSKINGCVVYAPELETVFLNMLDEYEIDDDHSFFGLSNLLERSVIVFLRKYKKTSDLNKSGSRTNIEGYVFTHFREDLTLDSVSRHFGYSPTYFSKIFEKNTGVHFSTFLNDCRLSYAYSLLQISEMTVSDICFASGFNCLRNFNRCFLKKFGISPSQLRK